MLNFNNQPGTLSAEKSGGAIQRSASFLKRLLVVTLFCALSFMLSAPSLVQAEDLQEGTPAEQPSTNVQPVDTAAPAKLITSAAPENKAPAKANTQAGDGLEIGPEIIGQPVRAAANPKVNHVSIGDKTVSGKLSMGYNGRNKKKLDFTVHVIVDRIAGGKEEKTVKVLHTTRSQNWTVTLDSELAEGDKVTVKQEYGGEISEGVVLEVKKTLADQHKDDLKMPSGEIWIEHPNANLVNKDEQAEAIEMLKKANPDIANDFNLDKIKFSIDYTDHAYYEVTYTDGSTSGKIEAPDVIIKQVTETSVAPIIGKVQVTDGQIIVTFAKEVAQGTKFSFVKHFTDGEDRNFSQNGSCIVDKSDSKEMSQAVTVDGKKVTFPITDKVNDLKLGTEFGIVVKEPHKFRSCAKSEPVITPPDKVAVRDPHKLTDADRQAIDKAIRDANTVNGVSKLPDGTGFVTDPAFIEFDKDGNVTIISPNDVETDWDNDGNPIYAKNPDGTYKVNDGAKVTKFPAKDLVKNIAPKSPAIAVDTDKGEVTITPPAYENAGDDTDLASYTITYKDASDAEKTVSLTRTVDATGKTTWSSDGATVDANSGKVTLQIKDLAVGATITAKAKDKGGLEGDTEELESDPANATLETVEVTYDGNGGEGTMTDGKLKDGKTLNKGSKYKILDNAFTAPENEKFKTWKIGDTEYAAGAEITVKENTTIKAIWQDIEVKVSYSPNGGSGEMTGKTLKKGSKYTLLKSTFTAPDDTQEFKAWEVDGKEVAAGKEITVDKDTEVKALWKKIKVNVTYDGNGGGGSMTAATVDKGSEYTVLPNGFTAPDDTQEFDTWKVNGQRVAPGTVIKPDKDTVIKATWKKITKYKVTFDGNGGTGKMDEETVKKGDSFKLPANGFAPPAGKEFNGWQIDGKTYKVGESITVNGDVTVKALWKDKPVPPSTTPGKDKPGKQGKLQPQNPAAGGNLSKTGANGMYSLYGSLLLLATGGLFVISRRRRAQR